MKQLRVGNSDFTASEIILGCMRLTKLNRKEATALLETAYDCGIDFFDHADLYAFGASEELFAQALADSSIPRDKIKIQTKCGIRPKVCFDFSKKHILESVDASLQRLRTDHVESFLLHRPDTLMEPEEVAEAFTRLHESGKVLYFGVSNMRPYQIELLQKYVGQRLLINQLQFSAANTGMIDMGINVNMTNPQSVDHDGGILDYCRLKDITIQAWSPIQYGYFGGVFLGSELYPELNAVLDRLAGEKGVSSSAVAIAWILRHPAKIQPVLGTTKQQRVRDMCQASNITLTREEWYEIYLAAGNKLP